MSKKNNLKPILIVLGGLVAVLVLIQFMDKMSERSFKEYVVKVDTTAVTKIEITPKGDKSPVEIIKEGAKWMVSLENKKVRADENTLKEILKQVAAMKTEKVVSTSKDKWAELQVNDTTGTRVTMKNGNKTLADFFAGKFDYDPSTRSMASYVRNIKDNETYAIEGYLSMMFNRGKNTFREASVVMGQSDKWNKITFSYPSDSSFTLEKTEGHWNVNGMLADSVKVKNYFSNLSSLSSENFDDSVNISQGMMPEYTVKVETENNISIEVKGYLTDGKLVFTSSISEGNIFDDNKIAQVLLASPGHFLQ